MKSFGFNYVAGFNETVEEIGSLLLWRSGCGGCSRHVSIRTDIPEHKFGEGVRDFQDTCNKAPIAFICQIK
jgi:hypothetical protein